jgi:hypothetical protein
MAGFADENVPARASTLIRGKLKRYFDHGQKLALALTIMARIDIMAMTTCQGLPKLGSGT